MRGFSGIGTPSIGGLGRYFFIFSKAAWHDSSHAKGELFFIRWLKGWQCPIIFDMNLLIYNQRPWSPWSSLRFLGSSISWMTLILDWSILIPPMINSETQEFPRSDAKCVFEWVHLQLASSQYFKILTKVSYVFYPFLKLDHQIINIAFCLWHIFKNGLHGPLVCCLCIFRTKRHYFIAKNVFRCTKSRGLSIF